MLRADWEMAGPASGAVEQALIDAILPQLPRADIVLLSDYAKGVLTPRVIRNVIDAARRLGKRGHRRSEERQFRHLSRRDTAHAEPQGIRGSDPQPRRRRASIATAAREAMLLADGEAVLVTQSEHGMTLVPREGEVIHVPAHTVKVRDVTGAGDTVAATLAVSLAAGADWETALRTASAAAAVAVGKSGTAIVTLAELRRNILPHAFLAAEEKIAQSTGDSTSGCRRGVNRTCASVLPTAASISCIPATSRYSPQHAQPAIG